MVVCLYEDVANAGYPRSSWNIYTVKIQRLLFYRNFQPGWDATADAMKLSHGEHLLAIGDAVTRGVCLIHSSSSVVMVD